jgi:Bacterial conjugation TrbI-like protein
MVKRFVFLALAVLVSVPLALAENFSIPAGTTLHCRLTQTLSTQLNFQGDPFTATVSEPYLVNGKEVIPAGSTLEGRISELQRPGRLKGVGEMQLAVTRLSFPDGRSFTLNATLLSTYGAEGARVNSEEGVVRGPSSRIKDLEEVGTGMGGGGFLGTLIGGFHGAVIGGAIGGAAGLIDTLRRRGKDLTLPTGTQLNYQLTRPLVVDTVNAQAPAPSPNLSASR